MITDKDVAVEVRCSKCNDPMIITRPKFELMNSENASVAIWQHPRPYKCLKCGVKYVPFVNGFGGTQWSLMELSDNNYENQQSRVIKPNEETTGDKP